jgi:effector-binding domain-containing protein
VGPYQFLGEAWAQLRQQVTAADQRLSQDMASYEIYRNTPETVAEAKLLTELYLPVAQTTSATSGKAAQT